MNFVDKINNKLPTGWETNTGWFWSMVIIWTVTGLTLIAATVVVFERNVYTDVFIRHAMVLWVATLSMGALLSVTAILYKNLLEHEKND